jgi:osmotically-inducible protein OsmY
MTMVTDAQIQQDVIEELRWEPRVDESRIGVCVRDGVVVLSGAATSYAEKIAAQSAVHRVEGVLDVASGIEVRPSGPTKSDAAIAAAIRGALEWHAFVPDKVIHSTVSNGHVTLCGTVQRWTQREDAERAVRDLADVVGVTNNIGVAAAPAAADQIRHEVEAALRRQTDREIDRLGVEVEDGTVKLTGRVRSWAEKRAARAAAGAAPGVLAVADGLSVDPYS